jgi:hypothetical protein
MAARMATKNDRIVTDLVQYTTKGVRKCYRERNWNKREEDCAQGTETDNIPLLIRRVHAELSKPCLQRRVTTSRLSI